MHPISKYRVLLKNVNVNTKVSELKKFFKPIRIKDAKVLKRGIAVAYFKNKEDLDVALSKEGELHGTPVKVESYDSDLFINDVKPGEVKRIWPNISKSDLTGEIMENGRLFIRNLSYGCTENDIIELFTPFGTISDIHLSFDTKLQRSRGFAFVTFVFPADAVSALNKLDKTKFQGRLLHILPGKTRPNEDESPKNTNSKTDTDKEATDLDTPLSEFQRKRLSDLKATSSVSHNWNTLFISPDAVSTYLCAKFNVTKEQLFDSSNDNNSVSVRLAHGETQLVHELREFLLKEGVRLDLLEEGKTEGRRDRSEVKRADTHRQLSGTAFIIKNLPVGTKQEGVHELIQHITKSRGSSSAAEPKRIILPPLGITAIVEYAVPQVARLAYKALSYEPYKDSVLLLQWAPEGLLISKEQSNEALLGVKKKEMKSKKIKEEKLEELLTTEEPIDEEGEDKTEFEANPEESETMVDEPVVESRHRKKRRKMKLENEGKQDQKKADEAEIEQPQTKRSKLDEAAAPSETVSTEGDDLQRVILVRNVAFQASQDELTELFKPIGGLLKVRVPKKASGGHRGFAFVEFATKKHAEAALHTFGTDTHFYGRRLNIEYAKSGA